MCAQLTTYQYEPAALPRRTAASLGPAPGGRCREKRDDDEHRDADHRAHLRPDRQRGRAACEPGCRPPLVEEQDCGSDEERPDHEVVLRGGCLQRDHGQRGDEQSAEQCLRPGEADPPSHADHADRQREVRRRLDERHVPVGSAEHHRREDAHLAVRRVGVDVRRTGAVRIPDRLVLHPDARAPEVVEDRVEVVLRRRQPEQDGVAEGGEHGDGQHDADRLGEGVPQRCRRFPQSIADVAPPARVDDQGGADDREPGEEPPPRHPAEDRQGPEDPDELRPGRDVRPDEKRGRRSRPQHGRQPERSDAQQRAPGDERERPGHRPLAEKCW